MDKNLKIILIILCGLAITFTILHSWIPKENNSPAFNAELGYEVIEELQVSCQVDTDCELPFDYAIRSSCPFSAVCLEHSCVVICPFPFTGIPRES